MGLVIDTSAVIQLERKQLALPTALGSEPVILPAIVWAELLIGVRLAKTPQAAAQRRTQLEQLRATMSFSEVTADIAEHYADIYAELRRAGKVIPQNDMMIAATARKFDYGVLVGANDEAHFRQVNGLRVETLPT